MIDKKQLKDLIERTLREYHLYSEEAATLVYGTIAHESKRGTYLRQITSTYNFHVHALGIAQMEYTTFAWLCDLFGRQYKFERPDFERLEYDLKFSILLCRLRYRAVPHPLPTDIEGMANYYKKYYNSAAGAATPEDFIKALELK